MADHGGSAGRGERELAAYLAEVARRPPLTRDEEAELVVAAVQGGSDVARRRLIEAHLDLVVDIARRFEGEGRLPLLDLIQEGNSGLVHAAERFDWRQGFRFQTYATWWIRQSLTRAIARAA